jgi:hypothetical protein
MQHQHTTGDRWIHEYLWWRQGRGLLASAYRSALLRNGSDTSIR